MKKIDKKFFIHSFLLHFLAIIFLLLFNSNNKIARRFIVFGAHSKKPTHAYFQLLKQTTQSDWLKARMVTQKKTEPKKSVVKKPLQKPNPPKKTVIKKETKKPPIKKTVVKEEIKKIEKKIEPEKKIEQKEQPKILEKKEESEKEIEQEELCFNLTGNQDPRLAIYQRHIQKEVEHLWHPPIGVPKGTECSLSFIINSKGKVSKFEVIKRSKILIYDLSVLRIAKDLKLNECFWNKKFTIEFRQ